MVCARVISSGEKERELCQECAEALQPRLRGYCPACGRMYALEDAEPYLCAQCRQTPPVWDDFAFFGVYSGLLRDLILEFKFNAHFARRRVLRNLLQQAFDLHFGQDGPQIIVPVPLHRHRLHQRGFNQSLEIARKLSHPSRARLRPLAVYRIRATPAQSGLDRKERLKNVRNAFWAQKAMVQGQDVLLVDDVCTTGATLTACTLALRRAKASRVRVLVLASAPG